MRQTKNAQIRYKASKHKINDEFGQEIKPREFNRLAFWSAFFIAVLSAFQIGWHLAWYIATH